MSHIPSWIEPKIFEKVLQQTVPKYKEIKSFKVYDALGPGENYVAIALKVQIKVMLTDYSLHTQSYFLKIAHDTDLYHNVMYKWNVFNKETEVYRHFIPDFEQMYRDVGVEVRFGPKIYELPVEHEYLLLEDLNSLQFRNVNRQNSLDSHHIKFMLKKLAQWHAASAVRVERKGPYNDIYLKGSINPDGEPLVRAIGGTAIQNVIKAVKDMKNKDIYYKKLLKMSEGYADFLLQNVEHNPNQFNVLNHGDFWCNNMMFQYDENKKINDAYIIDYQMLRYASPGDDLIYFYVTSVQLDLKVSRFDEFVKYYHDNLIDNLKLLKYSKPLPSLGEIHKMIYEAKAYGTFAAFSIMPAALANPVESATLDNLVGDSEESVEAKALVLKEERIQKHLEVTLPWMYYKGYFD
ncbi:uncharacterized protein LOC106087284 [Stomoxys calcitrans]|uniref:uncharacterized protein LOC106087284 n=1 Tax=Stomoxys calcitrans TaxID=35570 RepID=UPI0027E2C373|nr:uncharacterized protein LOC106087284 [Stomoxys calcitrans]